VTQFDSPKQSLAGLSTEANAALLSAAADLVLVVDGQGVVQDVSSNAGALPVIGGLRSWVGRSWQEVVTIESRPKVAKLLNSSGDNRAIWRQVNVPSEEGADIPISFCAIPVGPKGRLIALGRDLRAQSEIQQQLVDAQQTMERDYLRLRHLESRYRILFDLTSEGVLVVDGKSQKIVFNARAERLLGSLRGRRDVPLVSYCAPLAARFDAWRTGSDEPDGYGETPLGRNLSARFVPVSRRRESGALIFIEDLTRLQRQARQIKLAAHGRLTANLAHEIRNPLGAISHAAELLQEDEPAESSSQRLLTIIRDNTQRLDRMVNEVLWLNRGDRPERDRIDVVEHVRRFVEQFVIAERIDAAVVRLEVRSGGAILFDKSHFDRVLWNLCGNALRHCRRGPGSVTLRIATDAGAGTVQLDVIDDGPGVPGPARGRLFEPFFTTSPGGSGLGLYIAREVCEANGASLDYLEGTAGAHFAVVCRAA